MRRNVSNRALGLYFFIGAVLVLIAIAQPGPLFGAGAAPIAPFLFIFGTPLIFVAILGLFIPRK